jgi:hypothetical protein
MLAQAQECFIEKVLIEKKKGTLVSKLSMHLSTTYLSIVDGLKLPALRSQFPDSWVDLFKLKQKYFYALSYYHQAIQCDIDARYGETVMYSAVAKQHADASFKLAVTFKSYYPKFSVSSEIILKPQSITSVIKEAVLKIAFEEEDELTSTSTIILEEMCNTLLQLTSKQNEAAIKDNDIIYNETVPNIDGKPLLDKLNAVKIIPFHDLLPNGAQDVPQIIGVDLFHKLIPLHTHESSSIYFQQKDNILKNLSEAISIADGDYEVTIASLNVHKTLSKLKQFIKNPRSLNNEMSDSLADSIHVFITEEKNLDIDDLILKLSSLKSTMQRDFDAIMSTLNTEQQSCEALRGKYLHKWTMEPSHIKSGGFQTNWNTYNGQLQRAIGVDAKLLSRVDQISKFRTLFKLSFDQISKEFSKQLKGSNENLIDDDPQLGMDVLGDQVLVEKIEGMLNSLNILKRDRGGLLLDLKKMVTISMI